MGTKKPSLRFFKPAKNPVRNPAWKETELKIDSLSREGRGVARHAGKVVFVDGALLQESVIARCTATQRSFDEARVVSVSNKSPDRVVPFCPLADSCGGCQLQHWHIDSQRQFKQEQLFSDLKKFNAKIIQENILAGDVQSFRHRLKLAVQPDKGFALAMRKEGSHDLISIPHCPIATSLVNQWIEKLPALLTSVNGLHQLTDIEIDEDTQGNVGLVCRFSRKPVDAVIQALFNALNNASAIAVQVDSGKGQWKTIHQQGQLSLKLDIPLSVSLIYCPGDFTQTNWTLNQNMIETALDWLAPQKNETALDLFSGIGNFSLPLAQRVNTVTAIELSQAMVDAAAANAERNDLNNIRFIARDLMQDDIALPEADIALLDPPRAGAEAVSKKLAKQKNLQRLVYVSCNPATLIRDAEILSAGGLKPVKAAFIDMFTYTGHSEAIVLFE